MNATEKRRTEVQLRTMKTRALKEMVAMMEVGNEVEREVLSMALDELGKRGTDLNDVTIGSEDVDARVARSR